MVAISYLSHFVTFYLFASSSTKTSSNNRDKQRNRKNNGNGNSNGDSNTRKKSSASTTTSSRSYDTNNRRTGRRRYSRTGDKINTKATSSSNGVNTSAAAATNSKKQEDVYPLPSLTKNSSGSRRRRPLYFTCRHTYEDTLIKEVKRHVEKKSSGGGVGVGGETTTTAARRKCSALSPYPGLVRVDLDDDFDDGDNILPNLYDPVYALQTMPDCVVISGDSIKNIANEIYESLLGNDDDDNDNDNDKKDNDNYNGVGSDKSKFTTTLQKQLQSAPRGSLAIHGLVPGMCKGQTKPIMLHRCEKVGEELTKRLRKRYPAARKGTNDVDVDAHVHVDVDLDGGLGLGAGTGVGEEKWLLQFMLQSNTIAVASLTKCQFVGPGKGAHWPNWEYPLGLVDVSIEEKMPSSAYRKLMEGLECMKIYPQVGSKVVDLGACPGGWTAVMRRLGSTVTAVDRSKLDPVLMDDDMVTFVKGDAFAFTPLGGGGASHNDDNVNDNDDDTWMISDIIAYPERCTELLHKWCGEKLANHMIVTMKFQGEEPDLDELDNAINVVASHGYDCRVKHFFNNKNEVTFMIWKRHTGTGVAENESGTNPLIGKPMYRRILPKS